MSIAKEERIDKQYYVESQQTIKITKKSCNEMADKGEDFLIKMKLLINELSNQRIEDIRNSFSKLFD